MTEITGTHVKLPEAVRRFVLHWGSMADRWGVTRSMSQVHALLFASERPLTADEIAELLGMARSNVSTSLRELAGWNLIRRVPVLGDRRDYFEAETDVWTMVQRIADGRKKRELEPAAAALRECLAEASGDAAVSPQLRERLKEMLSFVERAGEWYEQMLALPKTQVLALMKLGSGVVRLLERSRGARKRSTNA
jgi:DNA-binding transcriptional regulator GbsR (MarR family)